MVTGLFGGELGIRTLGPFRDTAFRVLHLRPLGQLSICQSENRFQTIWKELTERTAKYLVFRTAGARRNTGFLADKTDTFSKIFECCTFDHSDNSPCLFSSGFLSRNLLKNSLERKQERRQKIFDFEIFCVEEYQGESGGRNSQLLPKFRVSPVMTASIRFHIRLKHGKTRFVHTILSVLREKVKRFLAKRLTYTGQSGYNNCVL